MWGKVELELLRKHGRDLIKSGELSRSNVEKSLAGTGLLKEFSLRQIRTRINYERDNL